ncbi:hypothetical protein HRG_012192 [Hirsutella rhossiliensis]
MLGPVSSFILSRRKPLASLYLEAVALNPTAILCQGHLFFLTLHYYCPRRSPALFDRRENDRRPEGIYDDGVEISDHGLVYPSVNKASDSNGAVVFPNTCMMQELVRTYLDQVLDREELGKPVDMPSIYTIHKDITKFPIVSMLSGELRMQKSYGWPSK